VREAHLVEGCHGLAIVLTGEEALAKVCRSGSELFFRFIKSFEAESKSNTELKALTIGDDARVEDVFCRLQTCAVSTSVTWCSLIGDSLVISLQVILDVLKVFNDSS
jgi:hypothetical protein